MTKRIKAVGYLRRSTKDQEASIDDQRTAILAYAEKHGYETIEWYSDDGVSGDETTKRHEFLRMLEDANIGKFQVVLCWDQDRFGRFDSIEAGFWIHPLRRAGVRLVRVTEGPIDWDDFTGRMMYGIIQEAKHRFLRDLSGNVLRGQVEAAKKGSWIGTPPYGYSLDGDTKDKRLVPDEAKLAVVQRIFREFVDHGKSMSAIAHGLTEDGILTSRGQNRWRGDAVKFILENPVYEGTFRYNRFSSAKYNTYRRGEITKGGRRGENPQEDWLVIRDHHPAIVDQQTFARAQAMLAKGKTGRSPHTPETNPYLFHGKLKCGRCGANMWGVDGHRYKCGNERYDRSCTGTSTNETVMLDYLVNTLERKVFGSKIAVDVLAISANAGQLDEGSIPGAFDRLKRMMLGNDRTGKKTDPAKLKTRIDRLDDRIRKARRNLAYIDDPANIAATEEAIAAMEEQRDELWWDYKSRPKEKDINDTVREVLDKLLRLATAKRNDIKMVLREIDHITVYTTTRGTGSGTRHTLEGADLSFFTAAVGVPSKSNPHPMLPKHVCRVCISARNVTCFAKSNCEYWVC
jgi:DNA invertase Pin-like site-specific DNA recombinase